MQRTKVNKTGNAWKKMGLKGSVPLGGGRGEGGGGREEGGGRREEITPPLPSPILFGARPFGKERNYTLTL